MREVAGDSAVVSENKLIRRLEQLVIELELDRRDFVVFGSGPLIAHGVPWCVSDLDVVARGETWCRARLYGLASTGAVNNSPTAVFWGGLIQFSAGWISKKWDADKLIDGAETVQGIPFASLDDVLAYKQELCRPKDRSHIKILHCLLRRSSSDSEREIDA